MCSTLFVLHYCPCYALAPPSVMRAGRGLQQFVPTLAGQSPVFCGPEAFFAFPTQAGGLEFDGVASIWIWQRKFEY